MHNGLVDRFVAWPAAIHLHDRYKVRLKTSRHNRQINLSCNGRTCGKNLALALLHFGATTDKGMGHLGFGLGAGPAATLQFRMPLLYIIYSGMVGIRLIWPLRISTARSGPIWSIAAGCYPGFFTTTGWLVG